MDENEPKRKKEKKRKRTKKVTSENGGRDGKEKRTYEPSDYTVYCLEILSKEIKVLLFETPRVIVLSLFGPTTKQRWLNC